MNYLQQLILAALICFSFQAKSQLSPDNGLNLESGSGLFNNLSDDNYTPLGLFADLKYGHEGIMFKASAGNPLGARSNFTENNPATEYYMQFSSVYLVCGSKRSETEFSSIEEYDKYYESWVIGLAKSLLLETL